MGNKGRGRGHSSATRGRGQNRPLSRIRKSSSPTAKTPAIVISSALDQNKLSPLYVPRSPIRTRAASGKAKQQSATASGKPQQPTVDGGAGPSSANAGTTTTTIPTSNEFEMLSDSDDDDKISTQRENNDPADEAKKAKMQKCALPRVRDRPPMIHVVDTLCSTVDDLLLPLNVEYFVKVTKVAVQVLAVDQRNYVKVLDVFKSNNVKYFTYENRNQKLVKIVLQGLGEMSVSEVTAELQDFDIAPIDVKVLSKKTTATGTHVLYLLYFEKGSVKLQDLRQVKCLSGYIVSWRFFTKRPTDTAQCHRCPKVRAWVSKLQFDPKMCQVWHGAPYRWLFPASQSKPAGRWCCRPAQTLGKMCELRRKSHRQFPGMHGEEDLRGAAGEKEEDTSVPSIIQFNGTTRGRH